MPNLKLQGVQVNNCSFVRGLLSTLILLTCSSLVFAEGPDLIQDRLKSNRNSQISFMAAPLHGSAPTITYQSDLALIPASLMKLLTSYVALKQLGRDFRFEIRMQLGVKDARGIAALTVWAPLGMPDLVIEDLYLVARRIKALGLNGLSKLVVIQDPRFLDNKDWPEAYQAKTSSLSINYNSIGTELCPSSESNNMKALLDLPELPNEIIGQVSSAIKDQKKPLSVNLEFQNSANIWQVQLSGYLPKTADCQLVYKAIPSAEYAFAPTLAKLLQQQGLVVEAYETKIEEPRVAAEASDIIFNSRPLSDILMRMNRFSSNFIARSLALALQYQKKSNSLEGSGAGLVEAALKQEYAEAASLKVHDASGLARENRVSAALLVRLLRSASKDPEIGVELQSSLVYSKLGTLRNRDFGASAESLRVKTGFINGVSGLAGFLTVKSGETWAFAIIQNGVKSRERALKFEEELIEEFYNRF